MGRRLMLLALILGLLALGGCGYFPVEERPVRVGEPVVVVTPVPGR